MELINKLKSCPKTYDILEYYVAFTPNFGSIPSFCYTEVNAIVIDKNGKRTKTTILKTAFSMFGFPSAYALVETCLKWKATISSLPVPKSHYEAYISGAFQWATLTNMARMPHPKFITDALRHAFENSKRPWKFYFGHGDTERLESFGKWLFGDYRSSKQYALSPIESGELTRKWLTQELIHRTEAGYGK